MVSIVKKVPSNLLSSPKKTFFSISNYSAIEIAAERERNISHPPSHYDITNWGDKEHMQLAKKNQYWGTQMCGEMSLSLSNAVGHSL